VRIEKGRHVAEAGGELGVQINKGDLEAICRGCADRRLARASGTDKANRWLSVLLHRRHAANVRGRE
jgi:hypothetical protein